jgi:hypothetical protein
MDSRWRVQTDNPQCSRSMQPVQKVKNRLAELEMDIIIDQVPDTANLQQEVWKDLLELSKSVPIGTPQWMIALEMSPIADKDRVIEKIKSWQQAAAGHPIRLQKAIKQLAVQERRRPKSTTSTRTPRSQARHRRSICISRWARTRSARFRRSERLSRQRTDSNAPLFHGAATAKRTAWDIDKTNAFRPHLAVDGHFAVDTGRLGEWQPIMR